MSKDPIEFVRHIRDIAMRIVREISFIDRTRHLEFLEGGNKKTNEKDEKPIPQK